MKLEEETIAVRPGEEFDLEKIEAYLREHIGVSARGSYLCGSSHRGPRTSRIYCGLVTGKAFCAARRLARYRPERTICSAKLVCCRRFLPSFRWPPGRTSSAMISRC